MVEVELGPRLAATPFRDGVLLINHVIYTNNDGDGKVNMEAERRRGGGQMMHQG
jgi:hypothetical protein